MSSTTEALAGAPVLLAVAIAALISALVTWTSRPLLQRYALARARTRGPHIASRPRRALASR
ncbi:UDP-N-acetylmuramyl pentapeptide phosphotransferase/UDP-N-acetylglucosamine-1-phosphate transferase [Bradyrhizobium liaoningense]